MIKYLCEPGIGSRSVINSSEKSRNLDAEPGCMDNNLTGLDGRAETSDVGISDGENIHGQADIQTGRLNCGAPREM